MKILLYGINFSPELTGIGKYTGEMAAWLAEQGHDVRVVTAPPYYPEWKLGQGFSNLWSCHDDACLRVYRCPLWVPAKPSGIKRLLHLASFALASLPVMLQQVVWRPDVVWVVEPPLFCAPLALLVARLSRASAWLHIQDYEVDAAFDLGLVKGTQVRRCVERAERWLMQRFDAVSTISQRMLARAQAKGVMASALRFFPNWVDLSPFALLPDDAVAAYRRELGIADSAVVVLYSGNMGGKQGLEILADVARLCAANPNMVFVFCGDGAGRADLVARCTGLNNVRWLSLQPVERLPALLNMADIHLLPQRADAADLVMPSKLTGMLASARPVVATANAGTELYGVVNGSGVKSQVCGLTVPPGDAEAFAGAIKRLAADEALRDRLGKAGHAYAQQHLDKEGVLRQFEADLKALVSSSGSCA